MTEILPVRLYAQPDSLTPEARDAEVRALLARGLLRVVLTRRMERCGMDLTGLRLIRHECAPPRPEVNITRHRRSQS